MPTVSRGGMVSAVPISWTWMLEQLLRAAYLVPRAATPLTRLDVVCMQLDRGIPTPRRPGTSRSPKRPRGRFNRASAIAS